MRATRPRKLECAGIASAALAQSVERKALNLVVMGSSPMGGTSFSKNSKQSPHMHPQTHTHTHSHAHTPHNERGSFAAERPTLIKLLPRHISCLHSFCWPLTTEVCLVFLAWRSLWSRKSVTQTHREREREKGKGPCELQILLNVCMSWQSRRPQYV